MIIKIQFKEGITLIVEAEKITEKENEIILNSNQKITFIQHL